MIKIPKDYKVTIDGGYLQFTGKIDGGYLQFTGKLQQDKNGDVVLEVEDKIVYSDTEPKKK